MQGLGTTGQQEKEEKKENESKNVKEKPMVNANVISMTNAEPKFVQNHQSALAAIDALIDRLENS